MFDLVTKLLLMSAIVVMYIRIRLYYAKKINSDKLSIIVWIVAMLITVLIKLKAELI